MPPNTIGLRGSSASPSTLNLNITPDQSSERVLELSQKIITRGSASPADLTVLLFFATSSSQNGQVPVDVQQALRDVLIKVPHAAEAIRKIRTEFMVPSMSDQSAAELQKAFTELTGQSGLDALGVKKLLALAGSQGRLSAEEVAGLETIAAQPQVSEENKSTLRSAVMETLVSQLEKVARDPSKATPIFKDILKSATADKRFFGAAEEAFFGSTFEGSASKDFRQLASSAPDASRLEMELAKRLSGKLDNTGTQKLFERIDANAIVGAQEAEFASTVNRDPDGRGPLSTKISKLGYLDQATKTKLTELVASAPTGAIATIDRGLQVAKGLVAKNGGGVLGAAANEKLLGSLDALTKGASLDAFALETWKSLRGITSDFSAKLDAAQMGLPTTTGPTNEYPPSGQAELSSIRQIADRIITPLTFTPDRYLQVSKFDGSTENFVGVGESNGPLSIVEHQGHAVVLNGNALLRFDVGQYVAKPIAPLPVTTGSYRLGEHDGALVAFNGAPTATEPAMLAYDDASNTWSPVAGAQVPAGELNVVTSLKGQGLLVINAAGAGSVLNAGAWSSLPSLPAQFAAQSATTDAGQILVTGTSTSASGTVTNELLGLDPANVAAGWSRVGHDLPWLVLDREHLLSAPKPSVIATPLGINGDALQPKKVPYSPAELERMTRLASEAFDELAASPTLSLDDATTGLELLETLKENGGLKPELAKKADAVFNKATLDDATLTVLGERFYEAKLSSQTEADVTAARAALQSPISHQALTRFIAQSRGSATQLEHLLSITPSNVAAGEADLLAAESSRALGRRVDTLVSSKISDADATALIAAAQTLKTNAPSVAAMADSNVQRAVALGRMAGNTPDAFRSYLASAKPPTDAEVRLAISWFAKTGGITTAELRALTALTDSDGVRTEGEQRAIESLDWRALAPNAKANAPRVMQGVTTVADILGDEKPDVGSVKVDGTGPLVVWSKETNFSSGGATVSVGSTDPIEYTANGLVSGPIRIAGRKALTDVNGLQPFPNGGTVTDEGFDQVQSLWAADNVLKRLKAAGVDLPSFLQNAQNNGTMKIKVNAIDDKNAFYSPAQNEVTMGTSGDTWHLASDTDVVTHELGHFTLDHLNPNMLGSGEGGAIHEGYGDMMAALMFNDPEIAEDFEPGNAKPYLRTAENEDTLSSVSTEVHDRGQVYAGFAWSMKKKLSELIGDDAEAANLMLAVTVAHPLFYSSSAVTPEQFLTAMQKGADVALQGKIGDSTLRELKDAMTKEGIKRELVPAGWAPAADAASPQLVAALSGRASPGAPAVSAPGGLSGAALAKRMTTFTGRTDIQFHVVAEPKIGTMRKAILQAHATGPNNKSYPVEDGFVTVAFNKENIEAIGGRGRALPPFDFTEPGFTQDEARIRARDLALKGLAAGDPRTNGYVQANIEAIFAPGNVTYQEVLSGGQRARKVITRAAEFSVRRDGTIEVSKIMHVD